MLIQYIHSYPPYWKLFLYPKPEDAPFHGYRDPLIMDWIKLAQDRDRWRELVNAVMNLRFLQSAGNFFTSKKTGYFLKKGSAVCSK